MDVRHRLREDELELRLGLLGFTDADTADALTAALVIGADPSAITRINHLAAALIEHFDDPGAQIFTAADAEHALGRGLLPMLAMLASSDQIVARLTERGIEPRIAWASLADLGQQVWVNRQTYGAFGLHTHRWLQTAWAGRLFALGRLQHELTRWPLGGEASEDEPGREPQEQGPQGPGLGPGAGLSGGEWVASLHIPQTGPLTAESVAESLQQGERFFAAHFTDRLPQRVVCSSWLLDPELAAGLPGSNIAEFASRFRLTGESEPGDRDAVFFTFRRRGEVDLRRLPRRTRLEKLVAERLEAGEHWRVCTGILSDNG